jgi:hypothetical protein
MRKRKIIPLNKPEENRFFYNAELIEECIGEAIDNREIFRNDTTTREVSNR